MAEVVVVVEECEDTATESAATVAGDDRGSSHLESASLTAVAEEVGETNAGRCGSVRVRPLCRRQAGM